MIIADVWKTAPFMALLILAGLQMVPGGVYEAARVDGASKWQQFTRITLPLIKPALMVAILFRTLDALRMYDLPVIMISESTNSPTAVISQLVITDTRSGNFNSASAVSTLIFLMVFVIAFIMVKYLGADVAGNQNMPKAQRSSLRDRLPSLRSPKHPSGQDAPPDVPDAPAATGASTGASGSNGAIGETERDRR